MKSASELAARALSRTEPHDEFLELCAVSTSGQLTEEEQKKLQEHLSVCQSCREALRQYQVVVDEAIPAIGASREIDTEADPSWSEDEAKRALFRRLEQEKDPPQNKLHPRQCKIQT
jgi:hypothetical protein